MNRTYLIAKTTVSPTYCIYVPETPIHFDLEGTLLSINTDKLSQNSCTISFSINEEAQTILRELYSSSYSADPSITFNDTIVSPYVQGSYYIDKIIDSDGTKITPSTFTQVLNKNVHACVQLYSIHSVTKQQSTKKFPMFIIKTLTFL